MYVIITRDNCEYCDKAKALMKEHNILYTVYNVQSPSSKWVLDLMKKAGYTKVPQIWNTDGVHIGGYQQLHQLLTEGPL